MKKFLAVTAAAIALVLAPAAAASAAPASDITLPSVYVEYVYGYTVDQTNTFSITNTGDAPAAFAVSLSGAADSVTRVLEPGESTWASGPRNLGTITVWPADDTSVGIVVKASAYDLLNPKGFKVNINDSTDVVKNTHEDWLTGGVQ